MTTPRPASERRAFGRRPTNLHAIALIPGRAPLRCTVCDMSEGGAKLDFGEPVLLPGRIRLQWEGTGEIAICEVRHVDGASAGVRFACDVGPQIARQNVAPRITPTSQPALAMAQPLEMVASHSKAATSLVQKFRENRVVAQRA